MPILHKQRWEQIQKFSLDNQTSSFKFSDRLAAENMWTKEYTLRVIEEYKAFMYLCSIGKNRTPSVAVDQCWHLHLLYTESYWDKFMPILGRNIHHGPTKGGVIEESRYMSQYSETLKVYKEVFEKTPPTDIWLPLFDRFDIRLVTVDILKHWIIPYGDLKAMWKAFSNFIKPW